MKKENKKIIGTGITAFTIGFLTGIILTKKTNSSNEEDVNSISDLPDEVSLKDLEEGGNDNEEEKGNS